MPSFARSFVLVGHIGTVSAGSECTYVLPLTNDGAAGFAPCIPPALESRNSGRARAHAFSLSLFLSLFRPSGLRFWRNEFTVTWPTRNCNLSWRSLLALFTLPSPAGVAREKGESWRDSSSATFGGTVTCCDREWRGTGLSVSAVIRDHRRSLVDAMMSNRYRRKISTVSTARINFVSLSESLPFHTRAGRRLFVLEDPRPRISRR